MKSRAERLREIIGIAVGHASVCWTPDRVFDSSEALKVADNLTREIIAIFKECVSEEQEYPFGQFEQVTPVIERVICKVDYWNKCREETLKNIEELR